MFNPLHRIPNQELFEKHLCNQSSHYENTDDFRYELREAITCYADGLCYKLRKTWCTTAKSTPFIVTKMNGDTGKSMKYVCIVRTVVCQDTCPVEAMSNSEKSSL